MNDVPTCAITGEAVAECHCLAAGETFECLQCGADVPIADRARLGLTCWCARCERTGPPDQD
jgi:hypothetical protein